jgi:HD-GYP domain-containing protein (c-di-GMP phosphodiesterase class II)
MRRISLANVSPGAELAGTIKIPSPHQGVHYKLRLEEGTELTKNQIERLRRLNVGKVPVKDEDTDDLNPFVYDERVEAAEQEIRQEFQNFQSEFENDDVSSRDIGQLRSAVDQLIESLQNSQIMAAFTTLKTHDNYTAEHSLDVAKISLQLVLANEERYRKKLKEESGASNKYINRNMLQDLGLGAMLHDLGKEEVPERIINKNGELNDDEWEKMKSHPSIGYKKLRKIDQHINAPVRVPARQHHEKYDGTGYPQGLEGDEIHLFGRIMAPADVYSALTSNRPYRDATPPSQAVSILHEMQAEGPHFDPSILDDFFQLVFPYPIGEEVTLSDGREGVVCDVDPDNPRQPTVRVLYEGDRRVDNPEDIQVPNHPGELRIVEPSRETGGLVRAR